jgi:putative Mg2+ transporter-C (MgtC) family protein
MTMLPEDIIKIALAILVGGLIGFEREVHDKAAGFRTLIFICVGSTLFTIFSLKIASFGNGDVARIAANIVSGVGFLGAGVILREGGQIKGLTTASTIWAVAALGMGVGAGQYLFVLATTGILLVVLWVFPAVEGFIEDLQDTRTYSILAPHDLQRSRELERIITSHKLVVKHRTISKQGDQMRILWEVTGRPERHNSLIENLSSEPNIHEFEYYS